MQREEKLPFSQEVLPDWLQGDPRWDLTQRVVAGTHFARSPLLSKFLLFVVAETLEGREGEITEQQIGVQVFDRLPGYRTAEDNIVRNYARQLRKRLAEHFAAEGSLEPLRIEIPVGGYVPVFVQVPESGIAQESQGLPAPASIESQSALAHSGPLRARICSAQGLETLGSACIAPGRVQCGAHLPHLGCPSAIPPVAPSFRAC